MTDDEFAEFLRQDYVLPIKLSSGEWLALQRQMFTTGLFVIPDKDLGGMVGWRCRWCYESMTRALHALVTWDGIGDDPPGPWVKQKGRNSEGRPVDRLNPQLANPEAEF